MPAIADGKAIHDLIQRCPPLDVNTSYCYLLLARDFAATSVVAEGPRGLLGFISAYLRPTAPDTLFVWQVAVDAEARGQRLASRMLDEILGRAAARGVQYLETTVSPDNTASIRMFEALARRRETQIVRAPLFPQELFGADAHEAEDLYRIGPLQSFTQECTK